MNVPPTVAAAISWEPSLAVPLSSTLGLEDLHDLLEVMRVDAHNRETVRRHEEENAG